MLTSETLLYATDASSGQSAKLNLRTIYKERPNGGHPAKVLGGGGLGLHKAAALRWSSACA